VSAFGLNGILGYVIAQSTYRGFADLNVTKFRGICFASQDQVRMARHLPHTGDPA
jgi:hypothetical protein